MRRLSVFRFTFEREPEEKNIHCRLAADSRLRFFSMSSHPRRTIFRLSRFSHRFRFNLTPFLRPGRNVVAVLVHYWAKVFTPIFPVPRTAGEIRSDGEWSAFPAETGNALRPPDWFPVRPEMTFQAGLSLNMTHAFNRSGAGSILTTPNGNRRRNGRNRREVVPRRFPNSRNLKRFPFPSVRPENYSAAMSFPTLRRTLPEGLSASPAAKRNFNLEELREKFGFLNCDKLAAVRGWIFPCTHPASPDRTDFTASSILERKRSVFTVRSARSGRNARRYRSRRTLDDGRVRRNSTAISSATAITAGRESMIFSFRSASRCRYIELHFTNFDEGASLFNTPDWFRPSCRCRVGLRLNVPTGKPRICASWGNGLLRFACTSITKIVRGGNRRFGTSPPASRFFSATLSGAITILPPRRSESPPAPAGTDIWRSLRRVFFPAGRSLRSPSRGSMRFMRIICSEPTRRR